MVPHLATEFITAEVGRPSIALRTLRNASSRFARPNIAGRASKLSLQSRERIDDRRCLKGSIATANCHLLEDTGLHEATNRFIGADEAPVDQVRSTVDGHNRG